MTPTLPPGLKKHDCHGADHPAPSSRQFYERRHKIARTDPLRKRDAALLRGVDNRGHYRPLQKVTRATAEEKKKSCLGLFCGPKWTECFFNKAGTRIPVTIIQIRTRLTFDLRFIAACRLDLLHFIYFLSHVSRLIPESCSFASCSVFRTLFFVALCSLL